MRSFAGKCGLLKRLRLRQLFLREAPPPSAMRADIEERPAGSILDSLAAARAEHRDVALRDLHKLARLSQPEALRIIEELRLAGLVEIEREEVDAFGALVRLKSADGTPDLTG